MQASTPAREEKDMDLNAFEPILSFVDELSQTISLRTAPAVLSAPIPEGQLPPVPGAELVDQIGPQVAALLAQLEKDLAGSATDESQAIQQIVASAVAALPPIDIAAVAQLQADSGQPAPGTAPPEPPPPPAPPPPQPGRRRGRPPKAPGG
jgi:hypothetical protein